MSTNLKGLPNGRLFTSSEVLKAINITYRQLSYWELKGIIKPSYQKLGTRDFKRYTHEDIDTLKRVKKLLDEGYSLPTTDTLKEIARRKEAEEALWYSEERYRSLTNDALDTSAVGIFILDKDFKIAWVNQALERFFGIQREKIIGQDKRQLIRKQIKNIFEDPELFAEKVFATYDNNTYIENFECHVLPEQERQERWLEHWSQPIKTGLYAGGRIEHYTDITQRKKAEEALKMSEQRRRIAIRCARIGVWDCDLVNNTVWWNESYDTLYGKRSQTTKDSWQWWVDRLHPEDRDRVMKSINAAIDGSGNEWYCEYRFRKASSNTYAYVVDRAWITRDATRKAIRILGAMMDITERKKVERTETGALR